MDTAKIRTFKLFSNTSKNGGFLCLTILLNLRSFTNCPRIMNKCLVNSSQLATIFGIVYRVTDCHAHPERSFDLCEVPAIIWCNFAPKI